MIDQLVNKIIAMIIWKILKREGISHPGQATMAAFTGRSFANFDEKKW